MGQKHIYTCDVEIFKTIDNQDKAYWLGFLLGDGHITKYNYLKLELSNKDISHLEKFKQLMCTNSQIKLSSKNCCYININYKNICIDLAKYGMINNKTYTVKTPNIDKSLLKHFYRGILDSDGWVCRHKNKKGNDQFEFGFCSANQIFLQEIKDWINQQLNINYGYLKHRKYKISGEAWQLIFGGTKNFKLISNLLYDNFECSSYLERKYNKTKDFLKEIYSS